MISGSNEQLLKQLEYTLLKRDCHSWWISKMQSDSWEEKYAITFCFKLGKRARETYGMLRTVFRPSCMNRASVFEWHKKFKEGRESVRDNERCGGGRKEVNTPEFIGQKVTMLRFNGSSGRDSVGRGQHSSHRVSGISSWTMHQSTTPSLSLTIWPRWASRQFLTVPIVQTLLPVSFGYSINCRYEKIWGDERGCDESHWHAYTRRLSWGLPEVVRTVQQLHCNQRRLLRRGLEFHVCTINKSAHTKKVWKLI